MTTDSRDAERRAQLRAEADAIEAAMRSAVDEALRIHKRAGLPVVTWEDGRIVWIPADQIVVNDPGT
jgi:methionine synthase II (cobalamin-independent)